MILLWRKRHCDGDYQGFCFFQLLTCTSEQISIDTAVKGILKLGILLSLEWYVLETSEDIAPQLSHEILQTFVWCSNVCKISRLCGIISSLLSKTYQPILLPDLANLLILECPLQWYQQWIFTDSLIRVCAKIIALNLSSDTKKISDEDIK